MSEVILYVKIVLIDQRKTFLINQSATYKVILFVTRELFCKVNTNFNFIIF